MVDIKHVVSKDGALFLKTIAGLKNKSLKVGWFENSKYNDTKKTPVANAVVQNEFGNPAKNIPPRPFIRPTIINREKAWQTLSGRNAKLMLQGKMTQDDFLKMLGGQVVFDIQKSIKAVQSPALSPVTVKRRLSRYKNQKTVGSLTKPLVDTGLMLSSIYSVIETDE